VGDEIAPVVVIVAPVTVATATITVPIGTIKWTMIVVMRAVGTTRTSNRLTSRGRDCTCHRNNSSPSTVTSSRSTSQGSASRQSARTSNLVCMVGVEVHNEDNIINKEEEEDDNVIKKDHSKDDVINKEDEDNEEEDSDYEYFKTDEEEDYDYENCETDNEEDNDYENYDNYVIDEEEDDENIIIKRPYQRFDLLKTRFAQKGVAISSLEGTEIDKPTNLSKESELHEFENLVSSSNDPNNGTMKRTIPPPLFWLMQKKGDMKMVPHNLMWDYQKKRRKRPRQ
jgi:hypothetical protein